MTGAVVVSAARPTLPTPISMVALGPRGSVALSHRLRGAVQHHKYAFLQELFRHRRH